MDVLDGEDFCFLTPTSVFVSRYGPGDISAIAPNSEGYTNLTCVNGAVFLWAINTKKPVRHIDQTFASRVIYTPTSSITGLRPFDTGLIIIEGNSSVSLYSFENGGTIQVYTGTGVQDAILTKGRELIIAKTAADNPQSPLISVDAQTRETVRLSLSGEIAFSLASSEYDGSGAIYGVTVSAQGNTRRTNLFSYTPSTQSSQILLYYAGENVTAFVGLRGSTLYTNIGKATAAYNVRTRAQTQLERPAGLSKKIAGNRRYIASLGTDGGVAWYEAGRTSLLDQWYVLQDGSWEKPAPPEPPPEPPAEPPAPAQAEEAPPQENTPPDEPL
jgi:hypothetical protein